MILGLGMDMKCFLTLGENNLWLAKLTLPESIQLVFLPVRRDPDS
jgi:hypothetical protein